MLTNIYSLFIFFADVVIASGDFSQSLQEIRAPLPIIFFEIVNGGVEGV